MLAERNRVTDHGGLHAGLFRITVLTLLVTIYPGVVTASQAQIPSAIKKAVNADARVGANVRSGYSAEDEEHDNRRVRFGWRELNLPSQLRNDELQVKADELKIEISRLRGHLLNSKQLVLHRYLVEQDKLAIRISNKLAQIWLGSGNESAQVVTAEIEQQFDTYVERCIPPHSEANMTMESLKRSCTNLHQIGIKIDGLKLSEAPVPSVFDEVLTVDLTVAQRLIQSDELQLEADRSSSWPTDLKFKLIEGDKTVIAIDKQVRLIEITHDSIVKHNAAHPENLITDVMDSMPIILEHRMHIVNFNSDSRKKISNF